MRIQDRQTYLCLDIICFRWYHSSKLVNLILRAAHYNLSFIVHIYNTQLDCVSFQMEQELYNWFLFSDFYIIYS